MRNGNIIGSPVCHTINMSARPYLCISLWFLPGVCKESRGTWGRELQDGYFWWVTCLNVMRSTCLIWRRSKHLVEVCQSSFLIFTFFDLKTYKRRYRRWHKRPCTWWTLQFLWQRRETATAGRYSRPSEIDFPRFRNKSSLERYKPRYCCLLLFQFRHFSGEFVGTVSCCLFLVQGDLIQLILLCSNASLLYSFRFFERGLYCCGGVVAKNSV